MNALRKQKVSITLSARTLAAVDRRARRDKALTRSAVIERWLAAAARRDAAWQLEQDTIAYYEALGARGQEEDARWADASTRALAELDD